MKPIAVFAAIVVSLLAGPGALASSGDSASASGSTKTVDINHFKFHPGVLEIGRGAKVVFSNSAKVTHTATDKGIFDTGRIKPGHSVSVRFEQKGTFAYHCKIHPFMHGKIVVN
jgi:plastocyanin